MENKPIFKPNPKLKLMGQVRELVTITNAYRTEQTCCQWILRYIHHFGGKTLPNNLGVKEVESFLFPLATEGKVSASTQQQALNALMAKLIYGCGLRLMVIAGVMKAGLSQKTDLCKSDFIHALSFEFLSPAPAPVSKGHSLQPSKPFKKS